MPAPRYAHLPLVVAPTREKLAKSRQSVPVDPAQAGAVLAGVLRLLGHEPPPELDRGRPAALLAWGASNWCPAAFQGVSTVTPRDTPVVK
jgi:glutamyl-Q tRNA(Asp) synthetase